MHNFQLFNMAIVKKIKGIVFLKTFSIQEEHGGFDWKNWVGGVAGNAFENILTVFIGCGQKYFMLLTGLVKIFSL